MFHLTPPPAGARPASLAPWNETVLYRFTGGDDGSVPYGKVIFGPDGSLYGTTTGYPDGRPGSTPQRHSDPDSSYCNSGFGGNCGNVYKLTPSGGGWAESVLYSFQGYAGSGDGAHPYSEVIFDPAGNLYGTTDGAYDGESTVYKLTPSGSGWTENILCNLLGDPTYSEFPEAGLIADSSGNLYATFPREASTVAAHLLNSPRAPDATLLATGSMRRDHMTASPWMQPAIFTARSNMGDWQR